MRTFDAVDGQLPLAAFLALVAVVRPTGDERQIGAVLVARIDRDRGNLCAK